VAICNDLVVIFFSLARRMIVGTPFEVDRMFFCSFVIIIIVIIIL
jgi:hypothetical protein